MKNISQHLSQKQNKQERLNTMGKEKYILGYDIGGTKIGIGLATASGQLLGKKRVENKDTDPDVILPLLAQMGF